MKRFLLTIVILGAVTVLSGCGFNSCCNTRSYATSSGCGDVCGYSTSCNTCSYGYGYNDWY